MYKPLITIVTVVYNGVDHIQNAIESVINQTYDNIEYIIIDGVSTDGTNEIIKQYTNHISVWISEPDGGIYDAMNKGIAMATGEWIGLLNSDDYYEKDCFEKVIKKAVEFPDIDIFHGLLRVVNKNGEVNEITGHNCNFLNKGMIEHPTCFVKRSVYEKFGNFDIKYKSSADYDLMLRLKENGLSFFLMENILTNFTTGGMSSTLIAILEALQIRYEHKIISLFKKCLLTMFYKIVSKF